MRHLRWRRATRAAGRPRPVAMELTGGPFLSGASRRFGWHREVGLFLGAYLAYSLARGLGRGSVDSALENATDVVAFQARFGLNVELAVQDWVSGLHVMQVLGFVYLAAQLVAVPVALIVVYRRRRIVYALLRTTLLTAWLLALPIYAAFPTAPPRLAGIGIVDVVSRESLVPLDAPLVGFFYNPVAAVPSLHAAFAVAVGIGVASSLESRLMRALALAWGPLVILVVIATGNHFVVDVLAGLALVGVAAGIALLVHVRGGRHRRRATFPRAAHRSAARPEQPAPRLRVALVSPYAWDTPGGVTTQVAGLARALRLRGVTVEVLAPTDGVVEEAGVVSLGPSVTVRPNDSVARVALGPRSLYRALRHLRAGRYDIVHLQEPFVPAACLGVLLFGPRPIVGTFHMYGPDSIPYRIFFPLARIAVRRLDARVAVSEAARACASHFVPGRYEVIPNGVSTPTAERRAPTSHTGGRVLFVGRNDPRKGLPTLLDAFGLLPPGTRLDLVGVGPEEFRAMAPAALRDRGADIVAHGRVSDAERQRLLSAADLVCAPSLSGESFGLVLAEAMAGGVPVIASSIPGYLDLLAGYGHLVPAGDEVALAAAVSNLLGRRGLRARLAVSGRRAAESFHWDRVADRVLRVYEEVLGSRARS